MTWMPRSTRTVLVLGTVALGGAAAAGEPAAPPVHDQWRTYAAPDPLPDQRILALHVSEDGLWVGTAGGLARLAAGAWTTWTEADGLPWPAVSAIATDPRTGDLWLGTWGGGLVRFSGGRFDQFSQLNSPLAGNLVFDVLADGERVWVATNGGLSAFDPASGSWQLYFQRRADGPETALTNLATDGRRLLAAAWCGGLFESDADRERWGPAVGPPEVLRGGGVAVAAAGRSLWWVSLDSLVRRDSAGVWQVRSLAGTLAAGRLITCAAARDDTAVWLGTRHGLMTLVDWSADAWVTYASGGEVILSRHGRVIDRRAVAATLPDDRVRCIALQGDGVWVGTAGGLAYGSGSRDPSTLEPWRDRTPDTGPASPEARARRTGAAVKIGILRPGDRTISIEGTGESGVPRLGRMDRLAVKLAVEHANARGGYRGSIPFAVATGPQGSFRGWGWTTPEDDFPALAGQPDVAGIVGYLGSGCALTTAVVLRTGVPLVNCAGTSATSDETANPWIFRCRGDRPQPLWRLLDYLFDELGCVRLAVIRTPGRSQLDRCSAYAAARGHAVVVDVRVDPRADDPAVVVRMLAGRGVDAVLTWDDAPTTARILRAMRAAGMDQLLVGGPEIIGDEFPVLAGAAPGDVIAAAPRAGGEPAIAAFTEAYRRRFGRPPPPAAYGVYRATGHLAEAINAAGLDREAIRRRLLESDRGTPCRHVPGDPDAVVLRRLMGGGWQLLGD